MGSEYSKKVPILDDVALNQIMELAGNDVEMFVDNIMQQYHSDAKQYLEEMFLYMQEENVEEIQALAHTFKSSSATLGGMRLASICREIETYADHEIGGLQYLIEEANNEYHLFKDQLTNVLVKQQNK